jgi:hypothetical protein
MQTPLGARPHRPTFENGSFKLAGRLLEFVSNYEPRWMVISLAIARQDPAYRATLLFDISFDFKLLLRKYIYQ